MNGAASTRPDSVHGLAPDRSENEPFDEDPTLYDDSPEDHGTPPRWVPTLLGATIFLLILANYLGRSLLANSAIESANGANALLEHPVRILALNASNMHLLATGFQVDWVWFLTVPLLRLLAPDPLFYALGYLYRHRARAWVESMFPGTERFFELLDGHGETPTVARSALEAMVLFAPNNPVCAIAGIMAMPLRRFVILNVTGTLGRLVIFKLISQRYADQISVVIGWIAKYQNYVLFAALGLFVLNLIVSGRKLSVASDGNLRGGQ